MTLSGGVTCFTVSLSASMGFIGYWAPVAPRVTLLRKLARRAWWCCLRDQDGLRLGHLPGSGGAGGRGVALTGRARAMAHP